METSVNDALPPRFSGTHKCVEGLVRAAHAAHAAYRKNPNQELSVVCAWCIIAYVFLSITGGGGLLVLALDSSMESEFYRTVASNVVVIVFILIDPLRSGCFLGLPGCASLHWDFCFQASRSSCCISTHPPQSMPRPAGMAKASALQPQQPPSAPPNPQRGG